MTELANSIALKVAWDAMQRDWIAINPARAGHPLLAKAAAGHGNVRPRADESAVPCGGPEICDVCSLEQEVYGYRDTRPTVRAAFVEVTSERLMVEMGFPHDAILTRADPTTTRGNFRMLIEHDSLEEVPAGNMYPTLTPGFRRDADGVLSFRWTPSHDWVVTEKAGKIDPDAPGMNVEKFFKAHVAKVQRDNLDFTVQECAHAAFSFAMDDMRTMMRNITHSLEQQEKEDGSAAE